MNSQLLLRRAVVDENLTVVAVAGEIDMATAGDLEKTLTVGLRRASSMVVHLSAVTFLGAAGLNVLVAAWRRCRARGVTLWIVASNRPVLLVLEATRLDRMLPVVPELPAVLAQRMGASLTASMVLDQARGVLMANSRIDAEEASILLNERARQAKLTPADFALQVLATIPVQPGPADVG